MTDLASDQFPKTRWTLISRLKSPDATISRRALEELCVQYYYPLYCYIRRRGLRHHDAQDALHEFLMKLLRLGAFEAAEAHKGRLRGLLATALQRFLIDWRSTQAQRERALDVEVPMSGAEVEELYRQECFTDDDTPERIFERKWGHALLTRVLERLGQTYAERGKAVTFDALRPVLLTGGSLRGHDVPRMAAGLSLTESTLRVVLNRFLRDYRELLEHEVFETVETRAEVADEITHLMRIFGRS